MEIESIVIFAVLSAIVYLIYNAVTGKSSSKPGQPGNHGNGQGLYPDLSKMQGNSIFRLYSQSVAHADAIFDKFKTLDEVTEAVRKAGLESCSLIFGIDFTASNVSQGQKTNGGRSLHHLDMLNLNPYQRVISILGEALESFDDDGLIPTFGFGDITTRDFSVFPLRAEGHCVGFQDTLEAYNQIVSRVRLSGPTSFAPIIYKAIELVRQQKAYHILIIVADGQVTSERATKDAIVEASKFPLSIILVGIGDGPWGMMEEFDDSLPTRKFDNFQFVDFHKIMNTARNPHAAFALAALMEIPDQFKKIRELGLLSF